MGISLNDFRPQVTVGLLLFTEGGHLGRVIVREVEIRGQYTFLPWIVAISAVMRAEGNLVCL